MTQRTKAEGDKRDQSLNLLPKLKTAEIEQNGLKRAEKRVKAVVNLFAHCYSKNSLPSF